MENEIAERQRDAQLDQKIRIAKSNEAFAEIRKQVKGLGLVDRQVDKLISKGRTKPVSFKKKDIELGDLVKYRNKNFLTEDANDILRSLIGAKRVGEREEKNNYQAKYQLTGNNIYGLSLEQRQKILKNINTPDGVALDLYIIEENRRRKRAKLKRLKKQEVINNISNQPYFSAKRTSAIY
jgi:hypothetical protein